MLYIIVVERAPLNNVILSNIMIRKRICGSHV